MSLAHLANFNNIYLKLRKVMALTLESPLDCKDIKPVRPKGHQSWVFTGGTDAVAETPKLSPTDAKS